MSRLSDLRDYYRIMGPLRFTIFFGGLTAILIGFASIGFWLASKTGWPEAYGFRCHGRGCLPIELYHSPALLQHGGLYALLLFAWMWLLPFAFGSAVGVIVLRRWLKRRRNRIRPLDY